ncbi:MAG: Stp1/IreP family PP2C-type Ser/Thr phosphatase [Myxacorys californica WJT36-NPBG1]|jgi:protein phosphatase|nr:Stp1/IreP family PP2C-type Ser/Thr phosphatase [Myxacorys californica WJT36-NPBG1]
MKRLFTGMTDTGLVRSANQDSYVIDSDGRFFVVADGMGGHAGGQEASRIATEVIQTFLTQYWNSEIPSEQLLEKAILEANQAILNDQTQHPERADMGTTLVVLMFRDEQPLCAHVGDSRLYRLRDATLQQLTEDHTWVARAVQLGELTPEQARSHPWRHVLAQCLGREDLQPVAIQPIEVQPCDRILLCTDGLTEELSDQIIATQLESIRVCEKAALALIDAAKDRGGRDNITVIVISIDAGR